MDIQAVLERLSLLRGPSGFERPVAETAVELMRPLLDEANVDRFGNAVGVRLCGRPGAPRLLLDAHLDEVGLMVTGVEEGFLRFRTIGGVDPRMLPDQEVTVLTDPPILGVVACLPPHVLKAEDMRRSIPVDQLRVDVGLTQEQAERAVPIGTSMVYREEPVLLRNGRFSGKALDDRACFAVLLRTAELLRDKSLDVDLYLLGSTREEVSGAGVRVGTYGIHPDFCVAVDVTHAKAPDTGSSRQSKLGGGPQIGMGPSMTRWMTQRMRTKAGELGIPCDVEVMEGHTGTNGWYMQTVREGIATAVVSLPLRYMHSPVETVALEDIESTAALLAAFIEHLGGEAERI